MNLTKITIRKMPGIYDAFTLKDLGNGLNLIVGNYATGKTSLCRAVRALLWPNADNPDPVSIETNWSDGSKALWAQRDGRRVIWQVDGSESPGPDLPDERVAHCFTIGVRDLLLDETHTDSQIAQEILRQMSGGYDVRAVADKNFTLPKKPGSSEWNKFTSSQRAVEEIKKEQLGLLEQEKGLKNSLKKQEESKRAAAYLTLLEYAKEYAEAKAELEGIYRELSNFPESMEKIKGNELERLQEITTESDSVVEKIRECKDRIQKAELGAEAADIPSGEVIEEHIIGALLERVRSLKERERDLTQAADLLEKAKEGAERLKRTLDPSMDLGALVEVDSESLKDIDSYFRRAEAVQAKKALAGEERALFESKGEYRPRQVYDQAISALHSWSAAHSLQQWVTAKGLGYLIGIVLAVVGGIVFNFESRIAALLIGGGLALLCGTWFVKRRLEETKRSFRAEYERLDHPPVPEWQPDYVIKCIQNLTEQLQDAVANEARAAQLERLEVREKEIAGESRELEEQREQLRSELGLDPGSTDLELYILAKTFLEYLESEKILAEATKMETNIEGDIHDKLSEINSTLEGYGCQAGTDAADVMAMADDLRNRNIRLSQTLDDLNRENRILEELEKDLARHEERISRLYTAAGIEPNDEVSLNEHLELHEYYGNVTKSQSEWGATETALESKLQGRDDLKDLTIEEVGQLEAEAKGRAGELTALSEIIGDIQGRVREAKEKDTLEKALAESQKAREALDEKLEEALFKTAGQFLLNKVSAEHEIHSRPEVLKKASDLFEQFTNHQYEILMDPRSDRQELRAMETSTSRGKALSELSDASRMQLLLASRLAYLDRAERGAKLPVFLDEVLTTTDSVRFRAIAESVLTMAGDGRQVFYLTANSADVSQWKRILEQNSLDPIKPIDLGVIRKMEAAVSGPETLEIEEIAEVFSPKGLSPEDYGVKIGVPPIYPDRPVNSMHLFYLLRQDLPILYILLQNGIETLGQWRSLVRSKSAEAFLEESTVKRVTSLGDAVEAFLELWQIGRGRKIDRSVLAAAKVTPTFLERLPSLVEELGGDAKLLLEKIDQKDDERVKKFRSNYRESLEEYLRENGYIDDRNILHEAEIKARVISAMSSAIDEDHTNAEEVAQMLTQFFSILNASSGHLTMNNTIAPQSMDLKGERH